ncbi:acyl-CoA/acyl-ACP dehydrogenase [Roseomonas terrae]|uniref:Acyl-CoA/acyl-ACP dehydrogenase n=1 Tax=Neoroseomonas terrae TaxID=424799 RepID=A0ABS5ELV1_9PROT|nr:acyl-CoA dehydrogenase family protein [Neoroseomonas terrae]MBR0652006.1 acyl-CoA/acyl-ACP dehydrogenase [Neoroseomonas terrae]
MVDLLPDPEQRQIEESFVEFVTKELPIDRLRGGESPNRDRELWQRIAHLGWLGLSIPEDAGGVGLSLAEETLLFRVCGRALVTPSLLATVLAARVALETKDAAAIETLLGGRRRAAFALAMPGSRPAKLLLLDAHPEDLLLLLHPAGARLIEPSDLGVWQELDPFDGTLTLAQADYPRADQAPAVTSSILRRADLLLAALQVGAAEAARDMAVAYAKDRNQFGQPIGSFQAVKHHCADMAVRCEAAGAQLAFAACAERDGIGEPEGPAQALLIARDAAMRNGAANIQIHGGLGFTAECHAQLFMKRAQVLAQLGTDARRALISALRDANASRAA